MPERKWWGWGYEEDGLDDAAFAKLLGALRRTLGEPELAPIEVPPFESIDLRAPRFALPDELGGFVTDDRRQRLGHSFGKAYVDLMRAVRGEVANPVDYVAYPKNELELSSLMSFCERESVAITPYGGGTSVVGGVEPTTSPRFRGSITVDLEHFDRLIAVDTHSQLAHVEAGMLGPALEAGLRPFGLTLRHFPQSFEFSSVGGWIATRAAGHYATGPTHIDDLTAGVRMMSPRGVIDVAPRGYAGGGPAPERMILGSEGVLGVITAAWLRLHESPVHRAGATVRFEDPSAGIGAIRAIVQTGLQPANCRLISPLESALTGLGDGRTANLLLGFESADHPVNAALEAAVEICAELGGTVDTPQTRAASADTGHDTWRRWFIQAPYIRDRLALHGLVVETFESACTWSAFDDLHARVLGDVQATVERECGRGLVTWRLAYAYPDGVAPYYTVIAVGESGREAEHWANIKRAASDALAASAGTTTHHHAVGRTHLPWYEQERGSLFLDAIRSAKEALDPAGIMNPGVLLHERGL